MVWKSGVLLPKSQHKMNVLLKGFFYLASGVDIVQISVDKSLPCQLAAKVHRGCKTNANRKFLPIL
ncbi:hypothetical protein A9P82_08575 [Arachidicoccus ginsenosidimutans]|nr:hypothetical protein A9P82_08575 [Arachidicoccus sp. BS20]